MDCRGGGGTKFTHEVVEGILQRTLIDNRRGRRDVEIRCIDIGMGHVARHLDVPGALLLNHGANDAINLICCRVSTAQHRLSAREVLEDAQLCVEALDLVMQHRVARPLVHAGSSTEDQEWDLLRPCVRGRIGHLETAGAIRDGHDAEPVQACVRIGREPGSLLICSDQDRQTLVLHRAKEPQGEVADDAECFGDSQFAQT